MIPSRKTTISLPRSSSTELTGAVPLRAKMAWLTIVWGGEKEIVLVQS